jgi:hypothetical protein
MPPVPQLPYKRPFFTITLNPHEIEVLSGAGGRLRAGLAAPARWRRRAQRPPAGSPPPAPPWRPQEDLALIITNTKRAGRVPRRVTPPPDRSNARAAMDRDDR